MDQQVGWWTQDRQRQTNSDTIRKRLTLPTFAEAGAHVQQLSSYLFTMLTESGATGKISNKEREMSACLVEGNLEQAESANWRIEVEKREKEKDWSRIREKGTWCPPGTVKHCFSSGDGSEERERERSGENSTQTPCTQTLPSSPFFSSPFCSHFLSQTQLSHHLHSEMITFY